MSLRLKLKKIDFIYRAWYTFRMMVNFVRYHISTERFTKQVFRKALGYELNLDNPQTLNEKIQWLKLNRMTQEYIQCADKYALRAYVADRFPKYADHFPQLLAVYDRADQIDLATLPEKFVLKCNHGCGFNYVCTDKSSVRIRELKKMVTRWMHTNYEYVACEPQYHNMEKKIFAEEFLSGEDGKCPPDYKFYCANGEPKAVIVCLERNDEHIAQYHYLDMDWKPLALDKSVDLNVTAQLNKPRNFEKMIEIAHALSADFAFVRVDFFDAADKAIIGEMTFTPAGGIDDDFDYETELMMGSWVDLNR